ncbi:unnamed protein product [Didymodactylos carnosus]|uniref:Uncharacterized protein n=1 Tax=Didymodactylos carnosus TaxID=1234261 RepID=A0A8S2GJZ8_9BILA|nr:unnamed protein product [Didymodactylos carnosus]CAF3526857.1 unnamed protein product [Didymodactylos carnosus]
MSHHPLLQDPTIAQIIQVADRLTGQRYSGAILTIIGNDRTASIIAGDNSFASLSFGQAFDSSSAFVGSNSVSGENALLLQGSFRGNSPYNENATSSIDSTGLLQGASLYQSDFGGAQSVASDYDTTNISPSEFDVNNLIQQYSTERSSVSTGFDSTQFSSANTDTASKIFQDRHPYIIRQPAKGGVIYQQNVSVRFLQPPPLPPPGPLIIKEVRPPQPPAPPPLVIRKKPAAVPTPPPLILREKPPQAPQPLAAKTIIRNLSAIPVPPRSVIIERFPAQPPKPRDIIIERWVPYGAQQKRKVILQRATAAKAYEKPRNTIVTYENIKANVVRQFQKLGVQQENPQSYVRRYGTNLLDAQQLLVHARQAGVIEDISPPDGQTLSTNYSSSSFDATNFNSEQLGNLGFGGVASTDYSNSGTAAYLSDNNATSLSTDFSPFTGNSTNIDSLIGSAGATSSTSGFASASFGTEFNTGSDLGLESTPATAFNTNNYGVNSGSDFSSANIGVSNNVSNEESYNTAGGQTQVFYINMNEDMHIVLKRFGITLD